MNQNHIIAYDYLFQAQQALKAGDRKIAQEYCDLAKQVAPDLEEVWLLQASLAAPQESIVFLEKALAINPASERAKRGMVWAQNRLKTDVALEPAIRASISNEPIEQIPSEAPETTLSDSSEALDEPVEEISTPAASDVSVAAASDVSVAAATIAGSKVVKEVIFQEATDVADEPIEVIPVVAAPVVREVTFQEATDISDEPIKVIPVAAAPDVREVTFQEATEVSDEPIEDIPAVATPVVSAAAPRPRRASASSSRTWITLASVAILVGLILVGYNYRDTISSTINVLLNGSNGDTRWSDVDLAAKATATPAQATPISTEVKKQAATALSLATSSPTTAPTLTNTKASTPTSTTVPTATESLVTVTPNPDLVGQASPTPLPTDTGEPTFAPYATATITVYQQDLPADALTDGGERWIDVNLSQQMVYAYEGDTMVNSFLTSTGTWEYPTVTGQYNVYVKYQYTDMSGIDYYLANVPNTMYFYDGYAIHGTYWHNNFGTPMSHGCVNLSIPDSDWVFNWATVGTLVNVHY